VAATFYRDVLGASVDELPLGGGLVVTFSDGHRLHVYGKGSRHEPASYTALALVVADIDEAVIRLNALGVATKIYDDAVLPTDERGIARTDSGSRAWFLDPARNVLSVAQLG
ncbi:MAG TPA: VOC family protein, partial [Agromyces sp.]